MSEGIPPMQLGQQQALPQAAPGSHVKATGNLAKKQLAQMRFNNVIPPNVDRVNVSCNGVKAVFMIHTQTIICRCPTCVDNNNQQGSRAMSPTEFERHSGMQASKKWRRSIKVELEHLGRNASMSLGRWLEQNGFKASTPPFEVRPTGVMQQLNGSPIRSAGMHFNGMGSPMNPMMQAAAMQAAFMQNHMNSKMLKRPMHQGMPGGMMGMMPGAPMMLQPGQMAYIIGPNGVPIPYMAGPGYADMQQQWHMQQGYMAPEEQQVSGDEGSDGEGSESKDDEDMMAADALALLKSNHDEGQPAALARQNSSRRSGPSAPSQQPSKPAQLKGRASSSTQQPSHSGTRVTPPATVGADGLPADYETASDTPDEEEPKPQQSKRNSTAAQQPPPAPPVYNEAGEMVLQFETGGNLPQPKQRTGVRTRNGLRPPVGESGMTENLLSHHEHRAASSHRHVPHRQPVISVVQPDGSLMPVQNNGWTMQQLIGGPAQNPASGAGSEQEEVEEDDQPAPAQRKAGPPAKAANGARAAEGKRTGPRVRKPVESPPRPVRTSKRTAVKRRVSESEGTEVGEEQEYVDGEEEDAGMQEPRSGRGVYPNMQPMYPGIMMPNGQYMMPPAGQQHMMMMQPGMGPQGYMHPGMMPGQMMPYGAGNGMMPHMGMPPMMQHGIMVHPAAPTYSMSQEVAYGAEGEDAAGMAQGAYMGAEVKEEEEEEAGYGAEEDVSQGVGSRGRQAPSRGGGKGRRGRGSSSQQLQLLQTYQDESDYEMDDNGEPVRPGKKRRAGNRPLRKPMTKKLLRGALQPMLLGHAEVTENGDLDVRTYCPYGDFFGVIAVLE